MIIRWELNSLSYEQMIAKKIDANEKKTVTALAGLLALAAFLCSGMLPIAMTKVGVEVQCIDS